MALTPFKPQPKSDCTPDPNNESNYCKSCNWTYTITIVYREHLKNVHKMIIPRIKPSPNPDILPDIDDPNHYCKSCQYNYKNRKIYCQHLKITHKIELLPSWRKAIFYPIISVVDTRNPNCTSCGICKFTYSDKHHYHRHMKKFHKYGENTPVTRKKIVKVFNIQPDPNDSKFYCASCQSYYKNSKYRNHIRSVHPHIQLEDNRRRPSITQLMAEIDDGNRDNKKCTICDRLYASRASYRVHFYWVHKDGKGEPAVRGNTRVAGSSADGKNSSPSNYCQLCQKTYANKVNYIRHTKQFTATNK